MKRLGIANKCRLAAVFVLFGSIAGVHAQSTQADFPTPIVSSEINGQIVPRAIGDPRLTTYYYYFNGDQGDIFINLVTENFAGDVDVFVADGLRLLSRIVVLADSQPSETGRVVYLRKPEKLLIRIQGRTPNDDPANFRIKFAGSFVAVRESEAQAVPELPTVPKPAADAGRVAEVRPADKEVVPEETAEEREKRAEIAERKPTEEAVKPTGETIVEKPKAEAVEPERKAPVQRETRAARRERERQAQKEAEAAERAAKQETAEPEKPADPMANFRLVVMFKDGSKIERPMTEVLRFTIDRGVLTVIAKDGSIGRYSMADIQRVGIE